MTSSSHQSAGWQRFSLPLLGAAMLGMTLLGSVAAHAVSTTIVISEFRFRGPGGASDEFVEIYNKSAADIDISGYKLQAESSGGTVGGDRATVPAGTILQPNKHFLFASSSSTYTGGVAGDATFGTGISDNRSVRIVDAAGTVIDSAGFAGSNGFEGTGIPAAATTGTIPTFERLPGGAAGNGTDTDNNANDFFVTATPNPQNLASPPTPVGNQQTNPSGQGSATPNVLEQGQQTLLEVTVVPGANPTSTGIAVQGNLSVIGGSATQPFFDNGTNGDRVPNDGTYSYLATVATTAPVGNPDISVRISDAQNRVGTVVIPLTVRAQTFPSTTIVIAEFRAAGPGGSGDEFVELLNVSNAAIDLTGYTLVYSSGGGSAPDPKVLTFGPTTIVPAGQRFLLAATGSSQEANANGTFGAFIANNGGIGLRDASSNLVDAAGLSDGTILKEGNAIVIPANYDANTQTFERLAFGANRQDTQNNAADFGVNTANPQGLAAVAPAAPTIVSFTPDSGPVGTQVVVTGTNFTGATQVAFNGTATANFTIDSATQITAIVPMGATTGTITVSTPGGTATSPTNFTVIAAPTITSFTPASGPVGTQVTITGTGFTGATQVAFNGTPATTFNVVSDTQITATVPAGATTGAITVSTPGGTATSPTDFTVIAAPTITSFAPASGPVGTSVVITGTGFTGATQVAFNGTAAAAFTVDSATQITATVPNGASTGTITVSTPGGTATSATDFTVTAAGPNQPPTVADVAKTTLEDTPVGFTTAEFDAAFTDPNPVDTLQSITIVSLPAQGTINGGTITVGQVIARADIPTLAYTPGANFNGVDTFQYTASDGQANAATPASVNITITAVNDAPSFVLGASPTVTEDDPAQTVAGFASAISPGPADEAAQTVLFTTAPATAADAALFTAGGQPAIGPDGTLTFTPAPNANGVANFNVTLQDNGGTANGGVDTSAPQAFSISVAPVNDAPTISAIGAQTTLEDTPTGAIAFTIGDVDGDPITVSATSSDQALVPDANIVPGGTLGDRNVVITPAPNANGTVDITVTVSDGTLTGSSTFTLAVTPVNDAPSFTVGAAQTVDEDAASQSVPNFITAISAGPANEATQSLTFTTTNDNTALFTDQPTITAAGTLGYTPAPNANGVATVSVVLKDNGGTANGGVNASAVQTFTITIDAVNDAPLAGADGPYFTDQDVALTVPAAQGVLANDTDVDNPNLTAVLISNVARGTLTFNPDGSFSYAPEAGFRGTTSFSYAASDGALQSQPIVVTIGVNATPQNISFGVSITPKAPKTNDVLTATPVILDPVGVTYTYEWSVNGAVKQSGASNTYNLATAGYGNKGDRIVCKVRAIQGIDSGVTSNFVNVFNSAPTATSVTGAATGGVETSFVLTGADADGDALTFKRVGGPINGVARIAPNADGTATLFYTPRANFAGVETIRFVALDATGKPSAVQTVTIDVTAAPAPPAPPAPNRAPSADNVSAMTFSGVEVAIPLSGSDPDGEPVTFKRVGGPVNGTGEIRLDSDGIFKMFYTPRANFDGVETIRFVALDTVGKPSAVATMTIDVIPPAAAAAMSSKAPSGGSS